jgi:hypothetical protein
MRSVIAGAILLGVGAANGWAAAPPRRAAPIAPGEPARQVEIVAPIGEIDRLRAQLDRLEAENDDLVAQVTQLLDEQTPWMAAAGLAGEPAAESAALATGPAEDRPRRWPPDWDSEEMQARREEFVREYAQRMQEFEDRIAAQITDPAGIERYNALMGLRDYQNELRDQLRNAKSDEEREAIRARMDEARRSGQQMVNDQQDAMLRAMAGANGITDPAAQSEFVSSMRQTLENPFFSMEGMLAGGGPPGRGFPSGGGRRGGRPSGRFQAGAQN